MKKRICNECNENKVGLLAWLFGLRHCEECDQRPIIENINRMRVTLTRVVLKNYDDGILDDYAVGKKLDELSGRR